MQNIFRLRKRNGVGNESNERKGKTKMAEMRYYTIGEFAELLKSRDMLEACELYGKEQTVIRLLTYDSREVAADTMFICKGAFPFISAI